MPDTQKPSIDERLEALTMNVELLAKHSEETGKRIEVLAETSERHEREQQRFRRAMRAALEAWLSEPGEA